MVWYSAAGNRLLVQTASNRIFETSDFQHWRLNTTDSAPTAAQAIRATAGAPEAAANLQQAGERIYATGKHNIYGSEDNGRTWLNLTGYNNRSVVGDGFSALAISPANAQEITAANEFGVWRSLDGGLSWRGLNDDLPNLPARKLIDRRVAGLADGTLIRFDSGTWTPFAAVDPETAIRAAIAQRSGRQFTAVAQADSILYGGTADGQLEVSRDGGTTRDRRPVAPYGQRRHLLGRCHWSAPSGSDPWNHRGPLGVDCVRSHRSRHLRRHSLVERRRRRDIELAVALCRLARRSRMGHQAESR
jgi:hypothetical protein